MMDVWFYGARRIFVTNCRKVNNPIKPFVTMIDPKSIRLLPLIFLWNCIAVSMKIDKRLTDMYNCNLSAIRWNIFFFIYIYRAFCNIDWTKIRMSISPDFLLKMFCNVLNKILARQKIYRHVQLQFPLDLLKHIYTTYTLISNIDNNKSFKNLLIYICTNGRHFPQNKY